ncbi:MAG: FitA-like ribbon-helix-helix domain-containing protein [Steroidobacteraceae bacterium]
MASITIRNLDEQTKARLRVRAAHGKRSMEEEARHILRKALSRNLEASPNLAHAIRGRFAPLGGVDLPLPEREIARDPPAPDR